MLRNLKLSFRMMRRNPALAASAIAITALGIGATTAMFTAADSILLRPLPFTRPDRLVNLWESNPARNMPTLVAAAGNYFDWRAQTRSFAAMGAWQGAQFNLASADAEPERYTGAVCDAGVFSVLGVKPVQGRLFTAAETEPGKDGVVLLSWGVWKQRFGGENVIGRELDVNSRRRVVIGIMPPGFDYPQQSAMWAPLALDPASHARRDLHTLRVIARLKEAVPLSEARAEMQTLAAALARQFPDLNADETAVAIPMLDDLVGNVRPALLVLVGAVLALLLIACANVANLLLARASGRRREMAIRSALGAGRGAVVGQMLSESLLLALIGGSAGVFLAYGALQGLLSVAPANTPRLDEIALNWRVAGLAIALSCATGLLFGLAPAWFCSRVDVSSMLKEGARGLSPRSRLRGALVSAQVAIALVLLAGAGLVIRSFYEVLHVDAGFRPENVMTMRLTPSLVKFRGHPELQRQLAAGILARVGALPGVRSTAIATNVPLLGTPVYIMRFEGRPPVTPSQAPLASYLAVTPSFFDAMGMRLVRGRALTDRDNENSPLAVVVNQTLVNRYFSGQDAIGKRLEIGFSDPPRWREIVGIVADVRSNGLDQDSPVQVFAPYFQMPSFPSSTVSPITVLARTAGEPGPIATPMRAAILEVDRSQPVFAIQPMTEIVAKSVAQRRLSLILLAFFAVSALLLAAIGVYGVMSFTVAQSTSEIGIRMALGAGAGQVAWQVQRRGMVLVLAGLAIGVAAALPLTQYLESMLFRVGPRDPLIFGAAAATLVLVSLVACYLPARRASRTDPAIALRNE